VLELVVVGVPEDSNVVSSNDERPLMLVSDSEMLVLVSVGSDSRLTVVRVRLSVGSVV